jgi:hypothetical protein
MTNPSHFRLASWITGRRAVLAAAVSMLALTGCDEVLAPNLELSLSEASVEFRAIRGAQGTLTQSVSVRNTGGGRLGPVSCPEDPAAWLSCSVSNGTMVTLTANPEGLTANPAPVSVTLSAPGGQATVEARLVLQEPVLAVNPGTLTFTAAEGQTGVTPASATVSVTNTGAGNLANLGAIQCAPTQATPNVSCTVDQGAGQLTVTANADGLPPGNQVFTLRVSSDHSAVVQDVTVRISVAASPRIGLSRQSVHFDAVRGGSAPSAQTVTVSNVGGGNLGAVSCPANPAVWLGCAVSGSGSTITFAVNQTGLTQDPTPVQVPISAVGAINSPTPIEVSLRLQQPVLALSRSSVTFTAAPGAAVTTPASDTITALNTGAGTAADLGTLTCTVPGASPVSCSIGQTTRVVQVSVNPTGIARGQHVFPVEVTAANSNVVRTLNVRLQVASPPTLVLTPSVRHFTAIRGSVGALSQTVAITNGGTGSLGAISCPANPAAWLGCVVNDSTQITLTANPTGLTSSPADVTVPVTAAGDAGSPRNIEVSFTIQQPILALTANEAQFTATGPNTTNPASVVITASNSGAGTLAQLGGLTCSVAAPATCTVDQGTGALTFTYDPTGAPPGTHVRVATVSAPHAGNGSRTVTLVLTVP